MIEVRRLWPFGLYPGVGNKWLCECTVCGDRVEPRFRYKGGASATRPPTDTCPLQSNATVTLATAPQDPCQNPCDVDKASHFELGMSSRLDLDRTTRAATVPGPSTPQGETAVAPA